MFGTARMNSIEMNMISILAHSNIVVNINSILTADSCPSYVRASSRYFLKISLLLFSFISQTITLICEMYDVQSACVYILTQIQ